MRRASIILILLAAILPAHLLAQFTNSSYSNPVGGQITASSTNCSVANACIWQKLPITATTTTVTITVPSAFSGTLLIETSADGGNTFTTQSTQTAAAVVTVTTTSLTDVRVRCSVYTSGLATANIQTAGNQINVTVGGSSASSLSVGSGIDVAQAPYNVKGDGVFVLDATTTSGNGTITVPDGAAFLNTVQVGMTIFGVSAGVANCPSRTTVLSVNVAGGTITVAAGTVTANTSANCYLSWGTDQTAAILSAATALKALPHCGILQFPSGGILWQKSFMNGTPSTCQQGGSGVGEGSGTVIAGRSRQTTQFMMTPDFDFTTCAGASNTCIGGTQLMIRDFSINGSNLVFSGTTTTSAMLLVGGGSISHDIGLYSGATSTSGLVGLLSNGNGDFLTATFVDGFGVTGMQIGQLNILCESCFAGNVAKPLILGPGSVSLISVDSTWGPTTLANQAVILNQSTYIAYGDFFNASAVNSAALQMSNAASKAFLNQCSLNNTTVASSQGIFWSAAGGTVQAIGTLIAGGATNGALYDIGNPGVFQDLSGNTFTNYVSASFTGTYLTSSNEVAKTLQKAETAADANVLTFTPLARPGSFRVRFVLSLSAANAATLGWTATWTDSNGNAQTPTNLALFQSGTAAPALTFTTSAAGNYYGEANIDVNNAAANIVIKLTFSGTSFAGKATAVVEQM